MASDGFSAAVTTPPKDHTRSTKEVRSATRKQVAGGPFNLRGATSFSMFGGSISNKVAQYSAKMRMPTNQGNTSILSSQGEYAFTSN